MLTESLYCREFPVPFSICRHVLLKYIAAIALIEAPIFSVADFGVVGDLFKVIPVVVAELKK